MQSKLTIRIAKELHIAVKVKAAKEERTVSDIVRQFLKEWLQEKDKPPPE